MKAGAGKKGPRKRDGVMNGEQGGTRGWGSEWPGLERRKGVGRGGRCPQVSPGKEAAGRLLVKSASRKFSARRGHKAAGLGWEQQRAAWGANKESPKSVDRTRVPSLFISPCATHSLSQAAPVTGRKECVCLRGRGSPH